jgi:hypothetical protein
MILNHFYVAHPITALPLSLTAVGDFLRGSKITPFAGVNVDVLVDPEKPGVRWPCHDLTEGHERAV